MNPTTTNEKLSPWPWSVTDASISFDVKTMEQQLKDFSRGCYVVNHSEKGVGIAQEAALASEQGANSNSHPVSAFAPALGTESLGDSNFRRVHGVKYAYYAGAMANGISSEELVIALGRAG
ncbi:MAG: 2-nitropropane dioxygenase, partial [Shewanella sp.]|nr:2-nitropropane dioxygenase [Shewanella sp.]